MDPRKREDSIPATTSDPSETEQNEASESRIRAFLANTRESKSYTSPYAPLPRQSDLLQLPSARRSLSPAIARTRSLTPADSTSPSGNLQLTANSPEPFDVRDFEKMSAPKQLTMADKNKLIQSLKNHSVNTVVDLRHIEKWLKVEKNRDVAEPMTNAWAHFVNSNHLLSELRSMTKSYPFSSECLDEAKWMVISDPQSSRSWNYCWLVLQKVVNQNLIPKHARQLATKPAMWGGKNPTAQNIEQLATACRNEWSRAITQMLRHWEGQPPVFPGM